MCRKCRESSSGAYPGAYLGISPNVATVGVDLKRPEDSRGQLQDLLKREPLEPPLPIALPLLRRYLERRPSTGLALRRSPFYAVLVGPAHRERERAAALAAGDVDGALTSRAVSG